MDHCMLVNSVKQFLCCICPKQDTDHLVAKFSNSSMAFSALTLLAWRQEGYPVCETLEWWGAGMVVCLEQGAVICIWSSWCHCHPIISCFIKIQIGLTFLVPAYPGCPEIRGHWTGVSLYVLSKGVCILSILCWRLSVSMIIMTVVWCKCRYSDLLTHGRWQSWMCWQSCIENLIWSSTSSLKLKFFAKISDLTSM